MYTDEMISSLNLSIGPLSYLFHARDDWGVEILDGIRDHISCIEIASEPDRTIILATEKEGAIDSVGFGEYFCSKTPSDLCRRENNIDTIWHSAQSPTVIWSKTACAEIGPVRFSLPWSLIIDDLVNLGGGLIHAGLTKHKDSGLLFIAPPNGGKSTTISTAPDSWDVLSDDAALIWPTDDGWVASPLPAWGDQIRVSEPWQWPAMGLGTICNINSIIQLNKAEEVKLKRMAAAETLPGLYQGLSEYPVSVMTGLDHREAYFRTSAKIVREVNSYQLFLPRHAEIWPLLESKAL